MRHTDKKRFGATLDKVQTKMPKPRFEAPMPLGYDGTMIWWDELSPMRDPIAGLTLSLIEKGEEIRYKQEIEHRREEERRQVIRQYGSAW